jgi:hypothetical protein
MRAVVGDAATGAVAVVAAARFVVVAAVAGFRVAAGFVAAAVVTGFGVVAGFTEAAADTFAFGAVEPTVVVRARLTLGLGFAAAWSGVEELVVGSGRVVGSAMRLA